MRIAITGANGFIGRYLATELANGGHEVVCCGRSVACEEISPCGERYACQYTDYSETSLRAVFAGCQQVVHLAGVRFARDVDFTAYQRNVSLAWNVLLASAGTGTQRVLLASSRAVYSAANRRPWVEDDHCLPCSLYGASKLAAEKLGEFAARHLGINVQSLRIAQVSGLGDRPGNLLETFIKRASDALPPVVFGEGHSRKEYIYVRDLVTAMRALIESSAPAGPYNIGSGEAHSLREIAEVVRSVYGISQQIEVRGDQEEIIEDNLLDVRKMREATGWSPAWSLRASLEEMRSLQAKEAGDSPRVHVRQR